MVGKYACLIKQDNGQIKLGKAALSTNNLIKNKNCKIICEKWVDDMKVLESYLIEGFEQIAERDGKKKNFWGDIDQMLKLFNSIIQKQKDKIYPYINNEMFVIHYPYCVAYDNDNYCFQNRSYFQLGKNEYANDPLIDATEIIEYKNFINFKKYKSGKLYFYDITTHPSKNMEYFKEYCKRLKRFMTWARKHKINEIGIKLNRDKI
jgi:hypothetical protein